MRRENKGLEEHGYPSEQNPRMSDTASAYASVQTGQNKNTKRENPVERAMADPSGDIASRYVWPHMPVGYSLRKWLWPE